MWFHSWHDLFRTLLVGSAAYVSLVVVLRVSGTRTLAKLNAFDLVVTVSLGSTLASILLSSTVAWTEGLLAFVLLAGLQYVVARVSVAVPRFRDVVTSPPTALVLDGVLLREQMRRRRVTEHEVWEAVRSSGQGDLAHVAAVVLETDGSLSVITPSALGDGSTLQDVHGWPRRISG